MQSAYNVVINFRNSGPLIQIAEAAGQLPGSYKKSDRGYRGLAVPAIRFEIIDRTVTGQWPDSDRTLTGQWLENKLTGGFNKNLFFVF